MAQSHILGFPRIGAKRELKQALEAYWAGTIDQTTLLNVGKQIRLTNWKIQADAGLSFVTVGDFSWYDHILDTSALLGVIPKRFEPTFGTEVDLDTLFTLGRGQAPNKKAIPALAITKWFNTNYHYLVPELTANQEFTLSSNKLFAEIKEAQELNFNVKPVITGPLTYLWLAKEKESSFSKLSLLPKLITIYNDIFAKLKQQNINYIQIDEPILTLELSKEWQDAFINTYNQLDFHTLNPILTTYFADLNENLNLVQKLPVKGLHIDICSEPRQLINIANIWPKDKILSVGIVNGRNIWKNDLTQSLSILHELEAKFGDNLWVSSSCSLLHSPVDLANETKLEIQIKNWLSFAVQKVSEIALLADGINSGENHIKEQLLDNQQAIRSRLTSPLINNSSIKQKVSAITTTTSSRKSPFAKRKELQQQHLNLPLFPTSTIGSFPQTSAIRKVRQEYKNGQITISDYNQQIKQEIKDAIIKQEQLGIDVLVHGEAERNDMVEYFGESLRGFTFTQNGWVQSYGSRCVKPPIIYGDISRYKPLTVEWTVYAQSLTSLPVKGMLTGPVTILAWSFVRDDQPYPYTALQIALALREEVIDLEKSGIKVIQIDEPAFREALPLKKKDWQQYLDWAVHAFKIASSGVSDSTQIHTHMCYSSFNDIIQSIAKLDADVITIEASRSDLELLKAFDRFSYPNQIGPGVYDIHSPNIPSVDEIVDKVEKILKYIPKEQLWINPDCGLKTRDWPEVYQALQNMQIAACTLRSKYTAEN